MVTISGSCFARNSGSMGFAPASGRSTLTPSLSSGAVIMKMTSNTNMTSMYGTTLISPISLRRRSFAGIGVYACGARAGPWRCRIVENSSTKVSNRSSRRLT